MFRRRKEGQPEDFAPGEADEYYQDEAEQGDPDPVRDGGGPWDAEEAYPERDRVDLGSLLVPVGPEHEVQLVMAEQFGAWVTVRHGQSELQVQAFAAPKRDALWDDVRAEITAEINNAGGQVSDAEAQGPFGAELIADVPADPNQPAAGTRTVRFIGVDGPRWFVRGLLGGPAATSPADADVLLEVFRDLVVNRGSHPAAPRELLELRLPPEAQQAMAEQAAAQEEARFNNDLNPFDRGPEFTETR